MLNICGSLSSGKRAFTTTRRYNARLRTEQAQMTKLRILETARRLLVEGTYSSVTMEEIAREAGVAYQTVYAAFGTKLRLATAMVEHGFPHVGEAVKLFDAPRASGDPELWLRTAARVFRLIHEPCADLIRFMVESGDPALQRQHREIGQSRLNRLREVAEALAHSKRLRPGLARADALDVLWVMTGPEFYWDFVYRCGWKPKRFQEWLGQSLIDLLLGAGGNHGSGATRSRAGSQSGRPKQPGAPWSGPFPARGTPHFAPPPRATPWPRPGA